MAYVKGRIGKIENGRITEYLPFQINPSGFRDTTGLEWAEQGSPGSPSPFFQYMGGKGRTITIQIFLDAYESHRYQVTLQQWIDFLDSFLPQAQFDDPPRLLLAYGPYVKECDLVDLEREFTMFNPSLEPIRATATLTLRVLKEG